MLFRLLNVVQELGYQPGKVYLPQTPWVRQELDLSKCFFLQGCYRIKLLKIPARQCILQLRCPEEVFNLSI